MDDIIISMLQSILGTSFANGADGLKHTVATYNTSAWEFANTLNSTAVKPVAASIVAIVLVLELARISSRFDGDQKLGVQLVANCMIKAVLVIVAIQNVDLVLGAINEVGERIITNTVTITPAAHDNILPSTVSDAVESMGTVDKAGTLLVLFVPWLLAVTGSLAVKVIVFVRFAELYILSSCATLPLAFLGHPETKSITVGYLRRYGGVVLQGVMIFVIIAVYSKFQINGMNWEGIDGDNMLSRLTTNIGELVAGPVFFMVLMLGSSRLAKALLGEG